MRLTRTQIFDRLHRTAVIGLLGLTAFGAFLLSARTYRYFTYVRPLQQDQKRMVAEEMIQQEQIEKEAELLQHQQEAEKLVE